MNNWLRPVIILFMAVSAIVQCHAQENIPLGEWRIHASFNRIHSIALGDNFIYAAASNGIVLIDRSDKSYTTLTKLNKLSKTGIKIVEYNQDSETLIVVYDDGTFDAIKDDRVTYVDPGSNTVLNGPRQIHQVTFRDNAAYLATDYGVMVFDLQRSQIKETWRDLGTNGSSLRIFGSTFFNDSIFLATESGVLTGDTDDNLLDFNKWKRMAAAELSGAVQHVATLNDKLFAAVDGIGVFEYGSSNSWSKKAFLQNVSFSSFNSSSSHLLVTESQHLWLIDETDNISEVDHLLIDRPLDAVEEPNGKLWIGDTFNGLLTNSFGQFESILPNGPVSDNAFKLTYSNLGLYMAPGGFSGVTGSGNRGVVSAFKNGAWSSIEVPVDDVTAIVFSDDGNQFVSSFGYGVLDVTTQTLFDESNSSLVNVNPPDRNVNVSSLHYSTDGLWVANYGNATSLHLYNKEKAWEAFTIPYAQGKYPTRILTDLYGNVWMLINPSNGGGLVVFDKESGESSLLTEADGNGELPSNAVYSIAVDRDGYVWAGTDGGVAYFYDKESDAVKPIYENRFLLRDEKVTAIAVDGGNRKWMGTERGVWLFNPTGETLIANFTAANSPLLSDKIIDIEINTKSGEVFFATDKGLISFRSDATEGGFAFETVKIFPNPVEYNFTGDIGITGLAMDAVVKITDVSGKLIYQTVANGGTASWNARDHFGRRVPTGVFLVFAVKPDGTESIVGKIAVIN